MSASGDVEENALIDGTHRADVLSLVLDVGGPRLEDAEPVYPEAADLESSCHDGVLECFGGFLYLKLSVSCARLLPVSNR